MVKVKPTSDVFKKPKTKLSKTKAIVKSTAESKKIKQKLKERKAIINAIKPTKVISVECIDIKPQIIKKTKKVKENLKKHEHIQEVFDNGEPAQINSDNFIEMKPQNIKTAIKGILKFRSENPKLKNQLFDEQFPIFLQISCFKVPKGFSKIYRIPLKHSLYNADSEICLIVSEVKGIKNVEHDQHKEHYENLLATKGVQNIKNIMTFHEFRTEYETFELKNRLVDLYDVFLADSKISGKVVKKCGKIFYKKRKVPTSVKLQVSKLKEHIDKTLAKTFLHLHLKGNSYTVQVGHSKMRIKELVENIQSIKEFLTKEFPGGFDNIMGIQVFAPRTTSIPLYMSTKFGKELEIPKIAVKKPKAFKTYRGELTTLPNAEVVVKPSGRVIVKELPDVEDDTPNEGISKEKGIKKSKGKHKGNTPKTADVENDEKLSNGKEHSQKSKRKHKEVIANSGEGTVEKTNKKHKLSNAVKEKKVKTIASSTTKVGSDKKKKEKDQLPNVLKERKRKKVKVGTLATEASFVISKISEGEVQLSKVVSKENSNKRQKLQIADKMQPIKQSTVMVKRTRKMSL